MVNKGKVMFEYPLPPSFTSYSNHAMTIVVKEARKWHSSVLQLLSTTDIFANTAVLCLEYQAQHLLASGCHREQKEKKSNFLLTFSVTQCGLVCFQFCSDHITLAGLEMSMWFKLAVILQRFTSRVLGFLLNVWFCYYLTCWLWLSLMLDLGFYCVLLWRSSGFTLLE